jgi:low affinity Fe/Cu permease
MGPMREPPSQIPHRRSSFDHFAERIADLVGRAGFFTACASAVLIWVPTIFIFHSADTWQLVIATATSVFAFLLLALLQNTERRANAALHKKVDAISEALETLIRRERLEDDEARERAADELRAAVGLEERT